MKKFFLVLGVALSLAACNNSADSAADTKDSLDSIATERKEGLDSTTDAKKDMIDSTTNAKKEMVDSMANHNDSNSKK